MLGVGNTERRSSSTDSSVELLESSGTSWAASTSLSLSPSAKNLFQASRDEVTKTAVSGEYGQGVSMAD